MGDSQPELEPLCHSEHWYRETGQQEKKKGRREKEKKKGRREEKKKGEKSGGGKVGGHKKPSLRRGGVGAGDEWQLMLFVLAAAMMVALAGTKALAMPRAMMTLVMDVVAVAVTALMMHLILMGLAELYVWTALYAAPMRPAALLTTVAWP